MTDAPNSLGPLEDVVAGELEFQQSHFDSLDTKAGIVLGLAEAIVALSADAVGTAATWPQVLATIAVVIGSLAAVTGLYSFWPRRFKVLDVEQVRDDALGLMTDATLRVALLDTRISAINANRGLLRRKAQRLKLSLSLLVTTVVLLGVAILIDRLGG